MQYDIATKVLMDQAAASLMERFLGIRTAEFEYVEELPQESVSLKRSDYILRVTDKDGKTQIGIWEFLSVWKRSAVLNLIDYTVRALIKFKLPVIPVLLLLRPAPAASNFFEEGGLRFTFTLVQFAEMSAAELLREADVCLFPFVPLMQGETHLIWEAEQRIYASGLATEEKADLLTAMTILAGLKDQQLARQLVERRRDIMIQSYGYDIIKEEGLAEGRQEGLQKGMAQGMAQGIKQGMKQGMKQGQMKRARKAICDVLEARFELVPVAVLSAIKEIQSLRILDELHRKAVKVNDLEEFRAVLKIVSA